ncbi:ATP-binding protein [Streptomyces sp. 2224.1]|uniref:ATP-binding protein n=1 Tax=Streptomyces sp. 2224.1 TaxID=1881020 RepID=UPI000B823E7E|nr:ATP-binding protein [Streptomyces sp. 2224.1]
MCQHGLLRREWETLFLAEAKGVAELRRFTRSHLELWGVPGIADTAQLCVSELVTNVLTHVGPGTPAALALSMRGGHLRIAVRDTDPRALPTLVSAPPSSESGRGLGLLAAMTDGWGVIPSSSGKVVWCELAVDAPHPEGKTVRPQIAHAEALITLYGRRMLPHGATDSPLVRTVAEEAAVDMIADLLRWLSFHGHDPDEVLNRAQDHFEADLKGVG